MKLTSCLRLLVAIAVLHLSSTHGAEISCDCTEFPFTPNPPCVDVCIPKHMAIAVAADLKDVFGLPSAIANTIAKIAPNNRPRRLEDYNYIILGYTIALNPEQRVESAVKGFEEKVHSLKADDFKRVQYDALKYDDMTIDKLEW